MYQKNTQPMYRLTHQSLHLDYPLLGLLCILVMTGLIVLYSASGAHISFVFKQSVRLLLAFSVLFMLSFIPPHRYQIWSPALYISGLTLLIAVMIMGKVGKGAQRWLDLSVFRFQPSEIMKLAVPMMAAWFVDKNPIEHSLKSLLLACLIILIPTILIAKQPDLGTAIMVAASGFCVIFLAGISPRILFGITTTTLLSLPALWHVMHDYQKERILTLLYPERDPLGSGYHIIQSKIAIGSGGGLGRGWLHGSQAHLSFLPEHTTDFIFAVVGEEFGFVGCVIIIILSMLITLRGLAIARQAQTRYSQLLAASLAMIFFLSSFVNISMVMGLLPVVGIPLPLVSYGGTAMVTFLAGFGILMSISGHRILFNHFTSR